MLFGEKSFHASRTSDKNSPGRLGTVPQSVFGKLGLFSLVAVTGPSDGLLDKMGVSVGDGSCGFLWLDSCWYKTH